MIVFNKVKWKNFLSTGNVFTEIQLDNHANTLIIGVNGAGKSTILDALTFALFGKPYRNINKPQIINSVNGKDCLVELYFSIGDKKYIIRRGMKPTIFEIYVDGVLLNQDSKSTDYQELLEKTIIKMNYKAFTQIVILGASSFTPFMQLTAADRREVIEDLLDIQIFSNMNVIVKEKISSLKDKLNEIKIRLDSVKEKIDLHKTHLDELKKNNNEMIQKKLDDIKIYENNIVELENDKADTEKKIEELSTQIENHNDLLIKNEKLSSYEVKIETSKNKLENEIEFYNTKDKCPTCRQDISQDFKKVMIEESNKIVSEYVAGLNKLKKQKDDVINRLNIIKSIMNDITSHEVHIKTINTSIIHTKKYIRSLQEEVEELSQHKSISDDTREQSKKLADELTKLIEDRKNTADEKQYYDVAAQLLKDGGIKTKIIKQYLPIINKMVNKYLASMYFFVNFNIYEEFKETIKSRHRDDFGYNNFSEGEKQKIDLSLLLTWRAVARLKNSVNTNLLILDETFDSSLDSKGTDSLLQILQTMPKNTNVFVISHKDQLHDKFSHSIRFEKKSNFSRIVQ